MASYHDARGAKSALTAMEVRDALCETHKYVHIKCVKSQCHVKAIVIASNMKTLQMIAAFVRICALP